MRSALSVSKSVGYFNRKKEKLAKRLVVLCYHSIVSENSPLNQRTNIAVTTTIFEQQLALLKKEWFPISLADLKEALLNGKTLPNHSVLITFDDGFRNNLTLAAPLLKKYEIPAVVFLTTGLIGTDQLLWTQEVAERQRRSHAQIIPTSELKRLPNSERLAYLENLRQNSTLEISEDWQRELYTFLNWDEVRQIRNFGVDIGAHTVSHPILTSLSQEELHQELIKSKQKIESEIDAECFTIAYPNGGQDDINDTVLNECKNCGFQLGFNLYNCRNLPQSEINPLSINRICVTRDLEMLKLEYLLVKG
ncbi:MAG: polysaccharide deacetylase family protein [Thermoguttaceae bacterium]